MYPVTFLLSNIAGNVLTTRLTILMISPHMAGNIASYVDPGPFVQKI